MNKNIFVMILLSLSFCSCASNSSDPCKDQWEESNNLISSIYTSELFGCYQQVYAEGDTPSYEFQGCMTAAGLNAFIGYQINDEDYADCMTNHG